jgi:oligogalacturonide lyase
VPRGSQIDTINADETLLAGQVAERTMELQPGSRGRDAKTDQAAYAALGPDGKPLPYAEAKEVRLNDRLEARIPMEIFTIDTRTGARRSVIRSTDWLNHLQFSPTDPGLLMYCHEGPWHKVDRIWTVRTDGTQNRKIHARTMNMEIAGHEFWSPDGRTIWYDLQTPRGEDFWLAGYDVADGKRRWYHLDRNQWSVHYNVSYDGRLFAGDGGDSEMVAHAPDGKWLYLFRPRAIPDVAGIHADDAASLIQPGVLEPEKLVDMSRQDYRLEPNARFTPDAKWLIFRANIQGDPAIYAVEVARAR